MTADPGQHATARRTARALLAVVVLAALGVLLLPVAPVTGTKTVVQWPEPGGTAESTMLTLLPYRPLALTAEVPCEAARGPAAGGVLFSTFPVEGRGSGQGLVVRQAGDDGVEVLSDGVDLWEGTLPAGACTLRVDVAGETTRVLVDDDLQVARAAEPPRTAVLATGLPATPGLSATVETDSRFEIRPTPLKVVLLVLLLGVGAACLVLLRRLDPPRAAPRLRPRLRPRFWPQDLVLTAVLAAWAVGGPVQPDDGYKVAVAAGYGETGFPGNRYYWYNAPETPFGLVERVLVPLVELTRAPVVLRALPVLAALLTWAVLSRALLPRLTPAGGRWVALLCLLAWWLPFNIGLRPEPYVSLASAVVLALVLRGVTERRLTPLAVGGLVAALSLATSPVGLLAVAPFVVLAPRLLPLLRARPAAPALLAAAVVAPGAAALAVVVFADQTLATVREATRIHTVIGPSVDWWREDIRYAYLFGLTDMGSFARRLPVLLALAVLVLVLAGRRRVRREGGVDLLLVVAGCTAVSLAVLALVPSKWTHHFGGLGAFAPLLLTGGLLRARQALAADAVARVVVPIVAVVVVAAGFGGGNLWWSYSSLLVEPELPGVLRQPLAWAALAAVLLAVTQRRRLTPATLLARAPAVIVVLGLLVGVVVTVGTHARAAVALSDSWSAAGQNLDHLTGGSCGMADAVQVLHPQPLRPVPGATGDQDPAFAVRRGAFVGPPSDLPASARWWGTFGVVPPGEAAELGTGSLVSPWYAVPALADGEELGVLRAGRAGGGNEVVAEFADTGDLAIVVGRLRLPAGESVHWQHSRLVVPPGADAVRVLARDETTGTGGWVAVSQPLRYEPEPLADLLPRAPAGVDWHHLSAFPCARSPVIAHGVAGTPEHVLLPFPSEVDALGALFFDERQGGTLALVPQVGVPEVLPTRLTGLPTLRPGAVQGWGTLVRYRYPYPQDRFALTVSEQPVSAVEWGYRYPLPVPPDPLEPRIDQGYDKGCGSPRVVTTGGCP